MVVDSRNIGRLGIEDLTTGKTIYHCSGNFTMRYFILEEPTELTPNEWVILVRDDTFMDIPEQRKSAVKLTMFTDERSFNNPFLYDYPANYGEKTDYDNIIF